MEKRKQFDRTKFSARILRKVIDACRAIAKDTKEKMTGNKVEIGYEIWEFDSQEEFLTSYSQENVQEADLSFRWNDTLSFYFFFCESHTSLMVRSDSRASIESIFSIFEEAPPEDKIVVTRQSRREGIRIFIGHGRSNQWIKLKSHLQDKHKLERFGIRNRSPRRAHYPRHP